VQIQALGGVCNAAGVKVGQYHILNAARPDSRREDDLEFPQLMEAQALTRAVFAKPRTHADARGPPAIFGSPLSTRLLNVSERHSGARDSASPASIDIGFFGN
jgi:hypothetical protein